MKRNLILAGIIMIAGFIASGCAGNKDLIAKASLENRQDVFTEAAGKNVLPDQAVADFTFSVKSNSSRFMWIYNKHTDPPYRVYLNIDGQSTVLEAEPVLEDKSPIDSSVPESGIGWKYDFSKRITLAPGKRTLTVALPVNDIIVEQEIVLREGTNTISLKPVYKKSLLRPYKGETFTEGVKTLGVTVN